MTATVDNTRVVTLLVAAVGLIMLVALAIPMARSILVPVGRLGTVIDALAQGDLTGRSGITSRDELGRMAAGLDGALESIRGSLTTIGRDADALAGAAGELSSVEGVDGYSLSHARN